MNFNNANVNNNNKDNNTDYVRAVCAFSGNCLTTGFPESRLEQVKAWIRDAGGIVSEVTDAGFVFSGIDGSADEGLVTDECCRKESTSELDLREMILSFDLSHSTPMDAMVFIDKLQKLYIRR